jgi:hypothetical protein
VVILSSVSSAERESLPKSSQGKDLSADDKADDILMADDIVGKADDISMADDKTKDIVSHRTAEQQRVPRLADDTDDKNSRSTCSNNSCRFKVGDLVKYSGQSDNLQRSIY